MDVAIIINPVSGTRDGARAGPARRDLAARVLDATRIDGEIFVTERRGHAFDLAGAALARGAHRVVAWGGDGTINEVARALVSTPAALGLVPAGSGNGLARALGIPRSSEAALRHALAAASRRIDVGRIAGHLFANIAGLGFDAHVAHAFDRTRGRGLRGYARVVSKELFSYRPGRYRVETGGTTTEHCAFLLSIANGPQWGNGARIAPGARFDDGLLDLVIAEASSALHAAVKIPRLFTGTIARASGITTLRVTSATISTDEPCCLHVDGEPVPSNACRLDASILPGALRVCG